MKSNSADDTIDNGLLLSGLDGANPLGFLAAMGTLAVVAAHNPSQPIRMSWRESHGSWSPRLHGCDSNPASLANQLANCLAVPFIPDPHADQLSDAAQKKLDAKRTELKNAVDSLKKRKLKGNQRTEALKAELDPIRDEVKLLRVIWLDALRKTVPSLELSLGKHLNASGEEFRESMRTVLDESRWNQRENADLYAAFGSDVCLTESGTMQPTPFCFTTGSGHQYFLDTVRQLFGCVSEQRFFSALSARTDPNDEKLSLRWDPIEDRRYAVMWSDPTASDNKARTNWALNLLAYKGLQMFPSAPNRSCALATTGWRTSRNPTWTWPIWEGKLNVDVVRSVLAHCELVVSTPRLANLRAVGVCAIFRSERIQVGNPPLHKINFGPAIQVG